MVYGDYGVGKTSLCLKVLDEKYESATIIRVTDVKQTSLSDIFRVAFEQLDFRVESYADVVSGNSNSAGTTSGFGISLKIISAKGQYDEQETQTASSGARTELLVKEPTDGKALRIFESYRVVFLIDELHYATQDLKDQLARCIKSVSDLNYKYPKFIFSGTANDSSALASTNPGVDRLLQEVRVPTFSNSESQELLGTGFDRLGFEVEEGVIDKISEVTAGAPSLVQSIGLEMSYLAIEDDRLVLDRRLSDALDEVIHSGANERMNERYNKAINHNGQLRYRTQVLHAMAASDHNYVTSDWIADHVSEQLGENVPTTTLSGPLRDLKQQEYGAILSDVISPSGKKVKNQTRFTQPQMKSFIRFLRKANEVDQ